MKKYIIISFALLLVLGLGSCKKQELPPQVDGEPVVWVEGLVNGFPFKYEAGDNASYATTIAHNIDSQSRQFIFKIDVPSEKISMEISMNNGANTLSEVQEDLDKTIRPGIYNFIYSNSFPTVPYRTSEIILLYHDLKTGSKYYTVPYNQSSVGGKFEIVSVKDYMHEGKRYKLAEISFSCRVKNPFNGFWYEIENGHGFIPFGE